MQQANNNNKIILDLLEVAKKQRVNIQDLTWRDYQELGNFSPSTVARRLGSWDEAKRKAAKADFKELKSEVKKTQMVEARDKKREEILESFIQFVREHGESPKAEDLAELGISRDSISRAFGSAPALESVARTKEPGAFKDVHLGSLFSPKAMLALGEATKKHRRFVVTTAVTKCDLHVPFYESVKAYCRENNAVLLVLVASDPAHNRDRGVVSLPKEQRYGTIDKRLANELIVIADTALNQNIALSTLKTSAKMIDPLTGADRLGQRNGSLIIASPKQRQRSVPVSNHKLPHVIMSTGAITESDYTTENYMSERLAYFADLDHQLGAIVVEIEDEELFHYRQIQADKKDGSFYELAGGKLKQYTSTGSLDVEFEKSAAALVLGDWHSGETDPDVGAAMAELARIVNPEYLVVHDGFNGLSINHHEEKDKLKRAQRAAANQLSLEHEVRMFASDIDLLSQLARKQVVVVKSNHDEFLDRYLKEGRYVEDDHNHYFSLKLALAKLEGWDPLQYAVERLIGLDKETNVRWLKRAEDFKIARIQLGSHGDKGPNGAKGTLATMEKAYGLSVTGHSHVPEILRGAWSVGTCSFLKLDYNQDSPSSWMNTSCVVYPNGQRQLINVIMGRWILKEV